MWKRHTSDIKLNFTIIYDMKLAQGLQRLSIDFSAFDMISPRQVSNNVSFPKTVMATVANFVHSEHPSEPARRERMLELFAA